MNHNTAISMYVKAPIGAAVGGATWATQYLPQFEGSLRLIAVVAGTLTSLALCVNAFIDLRRKWRNRNKELA